MEKKEEYALLNLPAIELMAVCNIFSRYNILFLDSHFFVDFQTYTTKTQILQTFTVICKAKSARQKGRLQTTCLGSYANDREAFPADLPWKIPQEHLSSVWQVGFCFTMAFCDHGTFSASSMDKLPFTLRLEGTRT